MITSSYFPDKTFATKEHLFAEMIENRDAILSMKKVERKSDSFGTILNTIPKLFSEKGMRMEENFIYPIINTTMFMDSHDDVQMNNSWNKSVKEQQGRIYYLADHEMKVDKIIAHPQDVEMMLKPFTWKELGFNYDGSTQALIFKIGIENIKMPQALDIIKNKYPIQNSVREKYIKVRFAVNSTSMDFKSEKEVWDEIYDQIANKEYADNRGYFFAVDESKIVNESSMVLFGSNSATPLLQKDIEAVTDTSRNEPSNDTQQAKQFFINLLN